MEETNFQQAVLYDDEAFRVGQLYIPGIHVNSTEYFKREPLDLKAIASRRNLPSFFMTITINF